MLLILAFICLTIAGIFLIRFFEKYFQNENPDTLFKSKEILINLNLKDRDSIFFIFIWMILFFILLERGFNGIWIIFSWFLLVLAFIDFKTQYLPDLITINLLWFGLLLNACGMVPQVTLQSAVLGAGVAYLSLRLLSYFYFLWRRQVGLGGGDMKLLAAIAAWMGLQSILPIMFMACLLGVVVSLFAARSRKLSYVFPFGPFLAFSALIFQVNYIR